MKYSDLSILHEDVSIYLACSSNTDILSTCESSSDEQFPELDSVVEGITNGQLNSESLNDPMVVRKLKNEMKRCKRYDKLLKILQKLNVILAGLTVGGGVASVAMRNSMANRNISSIKQQGFNTDMKTLKTGVNQIAAWQKREQSITARQNDPVDSFVDFIDGTSSDDRTFINGQRKSNPMPDFSDRINQDLNDRSHEIDNARAEADSSMSNTVKRTIVILLIHVAIAALIPLVRRALHNKEVKNASALKGQIDSSIRLYEKQLKDSKSEEDRTRLQGAINDLNSLKEMMNTEEN